MAGGEQDGDRMRNRRRGTTNGRVELWLSLKGRWLFGILVWPKRIRCVALAPSQSFQPMTNAASSIKFPPIIAQPRIQEPSFPRDPHPRRTRPMNDKGQGSGEWATQRDVGNGAGRMMAQFILGENSRIHYCKTCYFSTQLVHSRVPLFSQQHSPS
jgi:hypothetical protein